MIELRPLTNDNREALVALRIPAAQERFVSTVADSLLEADEEPGGRAIKFGLYDGDEPVGFVMISDDVDDSPEYIAHFLWKLLIDARFQRQGYGTAAVDLVARYFRERGVETMWTSASEGDGNPIPFYERYGFVRSGKAPWGEVLLRLDLAPK